MSDRKATPKFTTSEQFMALSEADRQEVVRQIESEDPGERRRRSKPLDASMRRAWKKARNLGGRPKFGKDGVKVIALSVEKQLLKDADAYAKQRGMKRAEFFSQAIREAMAKAG